MNKLIILLIFLLSINRAFAADADLLEFEELKIGVFTLHFHPVDRGFAMDVAAVVEASRSKLSQDIGIRDFRNCRIYIAFDPKHFYALAGAGFPHWGGACANTEKRRIVLKSPRWGDISRNPGATVRHEMTHIGVGILTRGKWLPMWLTEGIAVVESGLPMGMTNSGGSAMSISKALSTGSMLSLDEMEDLHGFGGLRANLVYLESESAVKFFLEKYGRVSLIQLLTLVGRDVGFEEAFDRTTGGGFYRFETEWNEWLEDNYGGYFLLDMSSWYWLLIIFLAIIAWITKKNRSRKIVASWDQEDNEDN
jgi:hypothetical protein